MLVRKGAEANLYLEEWYGLKVIKKVRVPKSYRLRQIDYKIRRSRTVHEAQIMSDAKRAGVPTPIIYLIDVKRTSIVMEYVEGPRVKEILNIIPRQERKILCRRIGGLIGQLHGKGIIHGDLTTSNMILGQNEKIFFIDFGLAEYSAEVEKRGVDLHLMKRALESTHYPHAKECYASIIAGYTVKVTSKNAEEVVKRVREIAQRGRYSGT
jgi:TP53 regulating kinase-like protein